MPPPRPPVEAVVDRCRWAVFRGAILPPATTFQHMDDAADDPAVINPSGAGLVRWKMRIDRTPRIIVQPENLSHTTLQGILNPLESFSSHKINYLIGFRP